MVVIREVLFRKIANGLTLKRLDECHSQVEDQVSIEIGLTGDSNLRCVLSAFKPQLTLVLPFRPLRCTRYTTRRGKASKVTVCAVLCICSTLHKCSVFQANLEEPSV
jgi:hypothetical protein